MITILSYRITDPDGTVWCAGGADNRGRSPEASLRRVQQLAKRNGVKSTYELCTKEEYAAYRMSLQQRIEEARVFK